MKNLFLLFGLMIFLASCEKKVSCHIDSKTLKSNDSIISIIKRDKSFNQFLNKHREPVLETLNQETYRFFKLNSFGNYSIYRVNENANHYIITTISHEIYLADTNFYKGDEMKILDNRSETVISKSQWLEIKALIDKIDFWELPVFTTKEIINDGTAYFIEGYSPEKNACTQRNYHATKRVSVKDSTIYKSIFNKITKFVENQ